MLRNLQFDVQVSFRYLETALELGCLKQNPGEPLSKDVAVYAFLFISFLFI